MELQEEKEQLLTKIEGTATWRAIKAKEYPEDAERNLKARDALLELYNYIESLPENHSLFKYIRSPWNLMDDEDVGDEIGAGESYVEELNNVLRIYGFQIQETPEKFVNETLMKIYNKS